LAFGQKFEVMIETELMNMEDKEIEKLDEETQQESNAENSSENENDKLDSDQETNPTEDLQNQLTEQKDKFLRLFAEFDNYKKRMAKDRLEYMSMAGKDVLLDMISIKDDFDRAMKSFENSDDLTAIKEGVGLIYDKLNKVIERKGVQKLDAKGHPFNVEIHEAITEVPVTDESQKGIVIDEIESGYKMHDKIIRFAKVVVGK
jgi:molecular chaperone GrpE